MQSDRSRSYSPGTHGIRTNIPDLSLVKRVKSLSPGISSTAEHVNESLMIEASDKFIKRPICKKSTGGKKLLKFSQNIEDTRKNEFRPQLCRKSTGGRKCNEIPISMSDTRKNESRKACDELEVVISCEGITPDVSSKDEKRSTFWSPLDLKNSAESKRPEAEVIDLTEGQLESDSNAIRETNPNEIELTRRSKIKCKKLSSENEIKPEIEIISSVDQSIENKNNILDSIDLTESEFHCETNPIEMEVVTSNENLRYEIENKSEMEIVSSIQEANDERNNAIDSTDLNEKTYKIRAIVEIEKTEAANLPDNEIFLKQEYEFSDLLDENKDGIDLNQGEVHPTFSVETIANVNVKGEKLNIEPDINPLNYCESIYETEEKCIKGYANFIENDFTLEAQDFAKFKNSKICSDVNIKCEDLIFHCHRLLLAQKSPYFMEQFQTDKKKTITITKDVKLSAFRIVVDYIYTQNLNLSDATVLDIFVAASALKIESVIEKCMDYIRENNLYFQVLKEFKKDDSVNHTRDRTTKLFMLKHLSEYAKMNEFLDLSFDKIKKLLIDYVSVGNTECILESALKWCSYSSKRIDNFSELLSSIDLYRISENETRKCCENYKNFLSKCPKESSILLQRILDRAFFKESAIVEQLPCVDREFGDFLIMGKFLDVAVNYGSNSRQYHAIILAANSAFFRRLFKRNGDSTILRLNDEFDDNVYDIIFEVMYSRYAPLTVENVGPLMIASLYLKFAALSAVCHRFIVRNKLFPLIISIFTNAQIKGKKLIAEYAKEYILSHIECFEGLEEYQNLSVINAKYLFIAASVGNLRATLAWLWKFVETHPNISDEEFDVISQWIVFAYKYARRKGVASRIDQITSVMTKSYEKILASKSMLRLLCFAELKDWLLNSQLNCETLLRAALTWLHHRPDCVARFDDICNQFPPVSLQHLEEICKLKLLNPALTLKLICAFAFNKSLNLEIESSLKLLEFVDFKAIEYEDILKIYDLKIVEIIYIMSMLLLKCESDSDFNAMRFEEDISSRMDSAIVSDVMKGVRILMLKRGIHITSSSDRNDQTSPVNNQSDGASWNYQCDNIPPVVIDVETGEELPLQSSQCFASKKPSTSPGLGKRKFNKYSKAHIDPKYPKSKHSKQDQDKKNLVAKFKDDVYEIVKKFAEPYYSKKFITSLEDYEQLVDEVVESVVKEELGNWGQLVMTEDIMQNISEHVIVYMALCGEVYTRKSPGFFPYKAKLSSRQKPKRCLRQGERASRYNRENNTRFYSSGRSSDSDSPDYNQSYNRCAEKQRYSSSPPPHNFTNPNMPQYPFMMMPVTMMIPVPMYCPFPLNFSQPNQMMQRSCDYQEASRRDPRLMSFRAANSSRVSNPSCATSGFEDQANRER